MRHEVPQRRVSRCVRFTPRDGSGACSLSRPCVAIIGSGAAVVVLASAVREHAASFAAAIVGASIFLVRRHQRRRCGQAGHELVRERQVPRACGRDLAAPALPGP